MKVIVDVDFDEHHEELHKGIIVPFLQEMEFTVWGKRLYFEHPHYTEETIEETCSITFADLAKKIIEFDKECSTSEDRELDDIGVDTIKAFLAAAEEVKAYLAAKEGTVKS